jgi:hypothetical protein
MRSRSTFLGPFELAYLNGFEVAANVKPFLERLPRMELKKLAYHLVLQSAADRLVLPKLDDDTATKMFIGKIHGNLSGRISFEDLPSELWVAATVPRPSKRNSTAVQRDAHSSAVNFVSSVLSARVGGHSVATFRGLPNLQKLEAEPDDFCALVSTFLKSVKPLEVG